MAEKRGAADVLGGPAAKKPAMDPDSIKALIEQKKREIEMKKNLLTASNPAAVGGGLLPVPAQAAAPPAAAAAKPAAPVIDIAALQARVRAQLPILQQAAATQAAPAAGLRPEEKRPMALILNEEGKMVDASGKEIRLQRRAPELKVNARAGRAEKAKALEEALNAPPETLEGKSYFDPRIAMPSAERKKRSFTFSAPGQHQQQAERLRTQAKLEKLQEEIAAQAQKTGIATVSKLIPMRRDADRKNETVPDVEWWDAAVLKSGSYEDVGSEGGPLKEVTNLVQHPIPIEPPNASKDTGVLPVMLTKEEKRKMRRQKRLADERDKQEKIRLGLMEPAAPKVKISNLMRVLGTEAVQDPTQVEAIVKAQMALRQEKHEEANRARMLTKEERIEKRETKKREDAAKSTEVLVFRINSLKNYRHKFKVRKGAEELGITGISLMQDDMAMVVAQGGPKAMKRYRRLLLHRVQWAKTEDGDEVEEGDKPANKCVLVWEGTVMERTFHAFEEKLCRTEAYAREYLQKYKAEHYYDIARSGAIVQESAL